VRKGGLPSLKIHLAMDITERGRKGVCRRFYLKDPLYTKDREEKAAQDISKKTKISPKQ
jgi:hypothetical protein